MYVDKSGGINNNQLMQAKPSFQDFRKSCPDVDEAFLSNHLRLLGDDYYSAFTQEEIHNHVKALADLSKEVPFICLSDISDTGTIICTVLAYDFPAVFSMITGLLSSTGYNILSGRIFTYKSSEKETPSAAVQNRHRRDLKMSSPNRKRMIIDVFTGRITRSVSFETWKKELEENLSEIFTILSAEKNDSIEKAREKINEKVVFALSQQKIADGRTLYPVTISDIFIGDTTTTLTIEAEDTPFFLYTLSSALSLHDISIENVSIRTTGNRVEDKIQIADFKGNPVSDPEKLNRIKISILFTKQFTYFLGTAPDPYRAFLRFENIIQEIEKSSSHGFLKNFLSEPMFMADLARLLGASDFLWADFLRNQYESILPMLSPSFQEKEFSTPSPELPFMIEKELSQAQTREDEKRILNDCKDREIYRIDLDHILSPGMDFQFLSRKLTVLAETIVNTAIALTWKHLKARYGTPVTIAGLDAKYAVLGLGKLGGAALGYASDIELLFVYGDNGKTDGAKSISNSEFFERLFREATRMIETRREGIFHVDLRLRPFGKGSPLACSLENFVRYFGKGGSAHSFEKLALIRMRAIGGDHDLGRRIERLRDELIYASQDIDIKSLRDLRQKQLEEKSIPGKLNAKFSPGALVDLEYTVQILQCIQGKDNLNLRTPRIHVALEELAKAGVMSALEAKELTETYYFFRKLINGLRMLRGDAMDLFLPDVGSEEFMHLARRTGYSDEAGMLSPSRKLHLEFETRAATIRAFVESHLGRDSIPGPPAGNAADLILSKELPEDLKAKILLSGGFSDPARAYRNVLSLAGGEETKTQFARLAILAWDLLKQTPDPDMALNNWERFMQSSQDRRNHYTELLSQPKRLEILLDIFAGSQFLADTLVRNPDFFEWVSNPLHLHRVRSISDIEEELSHLQNDDTSQERWLNELRRLRRKEILRIGTRDICLKKSIREIFEELSNLAEALLGSALKKRWNLLSRPDGECCTGFAVLAYGKLGGRELNYSSDIDLLGVYDPDKTEISRSAFEQKCAAVLELSGKDLSGHTEEGYAYRVDFRLRPFGRAGSLVHSRSSIIDYFTNSASLWEHQALLRLRPVAGDLELGRELLSSLRPLLLRRWERKEVAASIDSLRTKAIKAGDRSHLQGVDVKNGMGGIRDIEFLLQGLQLVNCAANPEIISGNTLSGLDKLKEHQILPEKAVSSLKEDYVFLRRVEHFLQIFEDRQTHVLPRGEKQREALSRRISRDSGEDSFKKIDETMTRVRGYYRQFLLEDDGSSETGS